MLRRSLIGPFLGKDVSLKSTDTPQAAAPIGLTGLGHLTEDTQAAGLRFSLAYASHPIGFPDCNPWTTQAYFRTHANLSGSSHFQDDTTKLVSCGNRLVTFRRSRPRVWHGSHGLPSGCF